MLFLTFEPKILDSTLPAVSLLTIGKFQFCGHAERWHWDRASVSTSTGWMLHWQTCYVLCLRCPFLMVPVGIVCNYCCPSLAYCKEHDSISCITLSSSFQVSKAQVSINNCHHLDWKKILVIKKKSSRAVWFVKPDMLTQWEKFYQSKKRSAIAFHSASVEWVMEHIVLKLFDKCHTGFSDYVAYTSNCNNKTILHHVVLGTSH